MTLRKNQKPTCDYDSMRRTTCCNCSAGCGLKVFLQGSKIIDIFGDEEHPINKGSICPKGMLAAYHLKNPNRLIHPQIRETLKDSFRSVSWSEALSFVSTRIEELSNKKGTDAIYIYGDEMAPFDYLAGASLFARYFGTSYVPSRFFPAPFGDEGLIKEIFGVPGSQLLMNSQIDWSNSRCILLYGCDLAASDPITFGPIIDARDHGMSLIAIDTKKTVTTSKAMLALRVNPGSKAILLKGVLNLLIQKGFIDEKFLKESTSGFDHLKLFIEPFGPEKVSKICGVKEEDLHQLVNLIGRAKPIQVITGNSDSRRSLSDEDLFLCGALVCVRGSVGIPGGGLNLLNTTPFSWDDLCKGEAHVSNINALPKNTDLTNLFLCSAEKVGALIWHGNPCARLRDGLKTKTALKDIPFMVHLSSYPNETYHYSHVSLPMSSWLEHSGLVAVNNSRALQWHHGITDPPGECRSPLQFWSDLASRFNLGEHFPWKTKEGIVDAIKACNIFLQNNQLTQAASVEGIDPEKNPSGGLLWPSIEETDLEFENTRFIRGTIRGRNILFQRTENYPLHERRFPTPSGKVSFSTPPQSGDGLKKNEADHLCKFPFFLTSGVLVDFVEAFGFFLSDREAYTKTGIIHMHPQLGKVLNVKNGDMVKVENEQGSITAPVWLNTDLDPRVLWFPDGVDPYQPNLGYESPHILFEAQNYAGYTMVSVCRPGAGRGKSERRVIDFLKR